MKVINDHIKISSNIIPNDRAGERGELLTHKVLGSIPRLGAKFIRHITGQIEMSDVFRCP